MSETEAERIRDRLLRTAGAVSTAVGLAGCMGDDGGDESEPEGSPGDDSASSEDEDDRSNGDPAVDAELIEPFGGWSIDRGELLLELDEGSSLDEVVFVDPLGQRADSASPSDVERSVSFDLYDTDPASREFYTSGTYRVLGFIEEERFPSPGDEDDASSEDDTSSEGGDSGDDDVPDIDPDNNPVVDGFVLVALTDLELRPELTLRTIEPSDETGTVRLSIANEGTGPLPIQYRFRTGFNSYLISDPRNWSLPEEATEVSPGEEVTIPVGIERQDIISGDEDEREEARETHCQGETEPYQLDLFIDRSRIVRSVGNVVYDGELEFDERSTGLSTEEWVYCSDVQEDS